MDPRPQRHLNDAPLTNLEWGELRNLLHGEPSPEAFGAVVDLLSYRSEADVAMDYAEQQLASWSPRICTTDAPFGGLGQASGRHHSELINFPPYSFFHNPATRLFKTIQCYLPDDDWETSTLEGADLRNLEVLDLYKVRFGDAGMRALFNNAMPRLRRLVLIDANFTDDAFFHILNAISAHNPSLSALEELTVHANLTDLSVQRLVNARLPNLKHLDIHGDELTLKGLLSLMQANFPKLESLEHHSVDDLNPTQRAECQAAFPNLRCLRSGW